MEDCAPCDSLLISIGPRISSFQDLLNEPRSLDLCCLLESLR